MFTSVPCPYLSSLSPSGGGFCPLSKVRYQRFIASRNFALVLCRVILTFERKFNSKESHFLNIISLLHHNNSACSFPSLKIKQSRSSFILVESNSSFVHIYDTQRMQTSSYCPYNYSILTVRRLFVWHYLDVPCKARESQGPIRWPSLVGAIEIHLIGGATD